MPFPFSTECCSGGEETDTDNPDDGLDAEFDVQDEEEQEDEGEAEEAEPGDCWDTAAVQGVVA